jgi:pimeloyl-ACP methyl ester carboxylesterase
VETSEHTTEIDGLPIHWRSAGDRPVLFVHGVPTASWDWLPFLKRIGGVAPDLPGFGESAKPGGFDYSIEGYADFLDAFADAAGLRRMTLVVHDWGSVGLAFAQRHPERIERLVAFSCVPFLPGYRWHRIARIWRRRSLGELAMGMTTRWAAKQVLREGFARPGPPPQDFVDHVWTHFDHGTQRAILRLYRASPPDVLERAGERLGDLRCPALILPGTKDPYIPERFGHDLAAALGGEATVEPVEAGHWPWLEQPRVIERVARFIDGAES